MQMHDTGHGERDKGKKEEDVIECVEVCLRD